MTTNMAELFALLRGLNRASSSSTLLSGQGPTVDPTYWILPTQISESANAPAPPTTHTLMVYPFTIPLPPPLAPKAVPLPQAAFLTSDQALSVPPPVSMLAPAAVYTIPLPTIFSVPSVPALVHPQAVEPPLYLSLQPHTSLPYQALPPINTTFPEPGTPTHAAHFASPMHFFPEADAEQEHRLKRMEETIRALQANETHPNESYGDGSLFPGMWLPIEAKWRAQAAKHIPSISEVQQIQLFHSTLRGVYYSHLLANTSSFSDLIEAGKKLDMGIKLGRTEGPVGKGEGEPSRRTTVGVPSTGGRKGKETAVNIINPGHPRAQHYSVNLTPIPLAALAYFLPSPQHQPQSIYYSAPPVPPLMTSQPFVHHYTPAPTPSPQTRPPVSRAPLPAQQTPDSQGPQVGAAQYQSRKQYIPLPAPLSHIYRQLLASNQIQPISPGLNFDPTTQDQSKHCDTIKARRGILLIIVGGYETRFREGSTTTGSPSMPSGLQMYRPTPSLITGRARDPP
ncbi:hypothetical protein CRG98_017865 [Punica granatum]|uniref:Extensin-like n=1 Tax=Punica granatum TaxID=22663 RepID=A0A2I0K0Z9_PUNGR|nr:hypothetical protein CRG98_017865 [Punica granatum]